MLFAAGILLAGISFIAGFRGGDNRALSRQVGRRLEKRLRILEKLADDPAPEKVPEDMVIYRYESDSLVAWYNQFPLFNDDITSRVEVQQISGLRGRIVSPLTDLTGEYAFVNYGPKWYVARCLDMGPLKVISGLEVANDLSEDRKYSIRPLSESVGSPVFVDGTPLFNISSVRLRDQGRRGSSLIWPAVLLIILSCLVWLNEKPSWGRYAIVAGAFVVMLGGLYLYGRTLSARYMLFSPILYADGPVLYSLGALLLVNLLLTLVIGSRSMVKGKRGIVTTVSSILGIVAVCCYIHLTFRSLVLNSGIATEIFKTATLSWYTLLVYLSYFLLAMTVPLLVKTFWDGAFSTPARTGFAAAAALYFVIASSVLGFRKESSRVEVWSNRLAMDRDIALELQLRSIDPYLQGDSRLALLSAQPGTNVKIGDVLSESYMNRIAPGNDIDVYLLGDENSRGVEAIFDRRVRRGTPISDNSHFYYSRDNNGRARYTGFFTYYIEGYGTSGLMICVESKANREDRGYLSLLGISDPGKVLLPHIYSYAKYVSGQLVTFKGNYAYPTVISDTFRETDGGFRHFVREIPEDELIIVSRPQIDWINYLVEGVIFGMVLFVLLTLAGLGSRRRDPEQKSYFRYRIVAVLYASLLMTLIAMAVFSVYFVYRRNEASRRDIISSKINSIQAVLTGRCRTAADYTDLMTQEMHSALENVGNSLKADITLFSPSGKAFMTTTPEIFERMIIGTRLDMDVLRSIVSEHRRFVVQSNRIGSHRYYSLYAPLFNGDGTMVAIIDSPYTDEDYELENEAISHIATILVLFLLLLLIARFFTSLLIDRLFRPLSEMSAKMEAADLDHLEYITYDRDDEVSGMVKAYNAMVTDLGRSTQQLAQAERDQAWTLMARQVAHEIKNPMTPIKLQLQMLILRKQQGDPTWAERFDEASKIILEHIDILVNTANEFSTYAKLGMEESVSIDLDTLLQDEVAMFSSRPDIEMTYIGLKGARIIGPKPQLTRCFVNLLTNAVQAVDQAREEHPGRKGRVTVSLRNSITDGYYDIVFEDNGPGVKEENRDKLFTPNFTTKSKGTGLGLAMSRSIIEYCKGEISYSRSFALGGACFTIKYPK